MAATIFRTVNDVHGNEVIVICVSKEIKSLSAVVRTEFSNDEERDEHGKPKCCRNFAIWLNVKKILEELFHGLIAEVGLLGKMTSAVTYYFIFYFLKRLFTVNSYSYFYLSCLGSLRNPESHPCIF